MRQFIGGNGTDTSTSVRSFCASNNKFKLADLYLIGELENPRSLFLTSWESPLLWNPWGTFHPAVIKRDKVTSQVGLDVPTMNVEWTPRLFTFTSEESTMHPIQRAQLGRYDNLKFRLWRCIMPEPGGDANTYGACEYFGGWISDTKVERGKIEFNITSFLYVVDQKVPPNVIELNNTLAGFRATKPPTGLSTLPRFDVITGSTPTVIYGECTSPTPGQIFADDTFNFGYLVFLDGAGQTLAGFWSAIFKSEDIVVGPNTYNKFTLFSPMPWAPSTSDTFYVSRTFPINQADGDYFGFPYVPSPEHAV